MRPPTVARRGLNVALLLLVVLHVLPLPGDPEWMVFGFVPWDLAVHLVWMGLATVVVLYMTGPPWPNEPPDELQPPLSPAPPTKDGER